jgi:outer membrane protein assembly factor BamB
MQVREFSKVAVLIVGLATALPSPGAHAPVRSFPGGAPVARKPVVPGANGDWTQWRGNPQHTGFQGMPGRMAHPRVEWRYRLGGAAAAHQVLVDRRPSDGGAGVYLGIGGRLQGFNSTGSSIFDRNPRLQFEILGSWDFGGDGKRELLAATSEISTNRLLLFSVETGDLLWEGPDTDGQVGSVKVLPDAAGARLLWLPAASSSLWFFDFAGRVTSPRVIWKRELHDFVSDPYSYSALAYSDLNHDGSPSVVIAGARGHVPVVVLDAERGTEKFRVALLDESGLEAGGTQQLLQVGDLDGSGHEQILLVSNHGSDAQYMFQGAAVVDPEHPEWFRVLNSAPVGLHYVPGSVGDFNGDGRLDLLVSRYDLGARRHDLLLFDAATLDLISTRQNFFLLAVQKRTDGTYDVVGSAGITSELPQPEGDLVGLRSQSSGAGFREVWRRTNSFDLFGSLVRQRGVGSPAIDNPGFSPVLLRDDGVDRARVVLRRWRSGNGGVELLSIGLNDGTTQSTFGPMVPFDVLGAEAGISRQKTSLALGTWEGDVVLLDGGLAIKSRIPVGGYSQNLALGGHSFEVAVVADLDGLGRRDIVVIDSQSRILRLLRDTPARLSNPGTQVLASAFTPQELCVAKDPGGGGRIFVAGANATGPKLSMIDGSGRTLWTHVFGGPSADPIEDATPIGLNVGRFGASGGPGVVMSAGSSQGLSRSLYALDLATGVLVWRAAGLGGYWDANLAVADVSGDGRDDVIVNANVWKAFLVSGASGDLIGKPALMPPFQDLGRVDYNGAPVFVRRGRDGARILIAQDDAHLSLVNAGAACGTSEPCPASVVWSSPQGGVDAERRSMAALAPLADGSILVGVGSTTGQLRAVRESDGLEAWHVGLEGGTVTADAAGASNPLSSVLALDVDGDGRIEFVVGGADGWLYALDAGTGRLVWSLDLGAPAGDPVAADFDNTGSSKILVPAADGYLYAVGPATTGS